MKIAVIGGGSTYTPELVSGFLARRSTLPLQELWLMDSDPERLAVVGGFARRMVQAQGRPFEVVLSADRRQALTGASYVITQLRVGMMPARRDDEYLGRRHGLVGQETTGVGGIAKALRTVPVILEIARELGQMAPTGRRPLLLNFTNPAGLITEALARYAPEVDAVGVCNVGITTKMGMLAEIEKLTGEAVAPERAALHTLGLNHLTWHRGLTIDGEDYWPRLFPLYLDRLRQQPDPEWEVSLLEALGMIPNYYLRYYYHTDRVVKAQAAWPPSRAETVMEIEKELLQGYADPSLTGLPAGLMQRGGAYYSTLATQLIDAHRCEASQGENDLGQVHVVNLRHNGAVPGWPADWVLEMPARVERGGIHSLPADPLPPACFGLVAQVKMVELLTVEAAVHGDRRAAYLALLAHPLGPPADRVQAVLDDLLETNRPYLPQFWG